MENKPNEQTKKKFSISFKVTNTLTNVKTKKATKVPKTFSVPKKKKISYYNEKFKDIKIVSDSHVFETQDNSIQQFLNSCHPEVRQFLNENEMSIIKAKVDSLEVITKNKYQVTIKPTGQFSRKITIKDKKGKIVLATESTSVINRSK